MKKKLPVFILFCIIFLAVLLRFYRIGEYTTFLGDEGRDMLVVKRMIVDHKLTLLGPVTSVGSMYMGPAYYYMMVPFLWLWRLDPVGPSVMVALFSILTIYLVYKTGAEFFNKRFGLLASLFYSISPLTIIYGRSSWNPNVVPFFTLLIIYSLLKITVKRDYRFFIIAGLSFGVAIQLHYITLLMIPVIILSLLTLKFDFPKNNLLKLIGGFIISYSPFILFEIRHGFVNWTAAYNFIFSDRGGFTLQIGPFITSASDITVRLFWRLLIVENAEFTKIFLIISSIIIYIFLRKKQFVKFKKPILIILLWLIGGVISYGLYHGVVYDYYLGSLFALPFFILAFVSIILLNWNRWGKITVFIALFGLCIFNFKKNPQLVGPNNMLGNTKVIAKFISDKTEGKPYNFALITGQNSDHAYRYFLEIWNHPPVTIQNPVIDPMRKTVTDQLLIVCEDKICQPEGHPLWEIAGFGRAEVVGQWNVVTVKVFKLVHYKQKEPEKL